MRYADTLNIYSKLREGFEEKEAKVIAVAIESALQEADEILLKEVVTKKDIVQMATKEDVANLRMATKEDITKLQMATKEDIVQMATKEDITKLDQDVMLLEAKIGVLEAKLKQEVTTLEANMKAYIANFKSEIIKWMFLFWIGQVAVVFGIVKFVR